MSHETHTDATKIECAMCGSDRVEILQRTAQYSRDAIQVSYLDELSRCDECGEEFYSHEQSLAHSRALTAALREAQGLMSADRIRQTRLRLRMTLSQFEDAMGVGANTIGRWERGTVAPSRAAIGMLWLADRYPEIFLEYARGRSGPSTVIQRDEAVVGQITAATSPTARPTAVRFRPQWTGEGSTSNPREQVDSVKECIV